MFSFNSLHHNSRPYATRRTFSAQRALAALLGLLTAFLFIGCPMDGGSGGGGGTTTFIPVGTWVDSFSGADSYTITNYAVDYLMPESSYGGTIYPAMVLKGSIERAVNFTSNAGVLIINITEATNGNTVGKYTGVYYKDCTSSSGSLATAIGPAPTYSPVEADSLQQALSLFTADNANTHVTSWGSYSK